MHLKQWLVQLSNIRISVVLGTNRISVVLGTNRISVVLGTNRISVVLTKYDICCFGYQHRISIDFGTNKLI